MRVHIAGLDVGAALGRAKALAERTAGRLMGGESSLNAHVKATWDSWVRVGLPTTLGRRPRFDSALQPETRRITVQPRSQFVRVYSPPHRSPYA